MSDKCDKCGHALGEETTESPYLEIAVLRSALEKTLLAIHDLPGMETSPIPDMIREVLR